MDRKPTHNYAAYKVPCGCLMATMYDEGNPKDLEQFQREWSSPRYRITRVERTPAFFMQCRDIGCNCHLDPPVEEGSNYRFAIHVTRIVYVDVPAPPGKRFIELEAQAIEEAQEFYGPCNIAEAAGWEIVK